MPCFPDFLSAQLTRREPSCGHVGRNNLMSPCIDCQLSRNASAAGNMCTIAWGKCQHVFHLHCISKWLQKRNVRSIACHVDSVCDTISRFTATYFRMYHTFSCFLFVFLFVFRRSRCAQWTHSLGLATAPWSASKRLCALSAHSHVTANAPRAQRLHE